MNISVGTFIAYIVALFILYVICRIFIRPLKWFFRLALSCTFGCFAMLIANKLFSLSFALNPLTAMISGILGIPGMVMAFILQGIL